jgi:hypothetical protein
MIDLNEIVDWSDKKLRTLRNNLNNRLESFKTDKINPKVLQASHKLYGMTEAQCKELLKKIQDTIKAKKKD